MAKVKKYRKTDQIKVGVIGYGGAFNMGKQHLEGCRKAGMKPFAVCDKDAARLDVAKADFPGIETYTDLDHMLRTSEVDLIIHITPHNLHYPLARKCLQAGKHVVTEKPFVVTTKEADSLIALAKKKGLMVSTYHNRHWDGWILRAKQQVVDKGLIGDVFRVEAHMGGYGMPRDWWRTSKTISGGILYDWGVHLLEYALQVVPGKVSEVSGFAKNGYWAEKMPKSHPWKKDANEDEASAIVRFDSGAMINLSISHLRSFGQPWFIGFFGTKGCYLIDWKQWTTRTADRQGKLVEKTGQHPASQGQKFYQNIADYLTGKDDLVITPEWARRPIHILDLAGQSAAKGKALKAKYG
jgi:scyllo-inositol 2-dehydrogenase (NADP+)